MGSPEADLERHLQGVEQAEAEWERFESWLRDLRPDLDPESEDAEDLFPLFIAEEQADADAYDEPDYDEPEPDDFWDDDGY